MQLARGQRLSLAELIGSTTLRIEIDLRGVAVDVSCFGLDANSQLSDDRYLVFFNQPATPCGGVRIANAAGAAAGFDLALDRLPDMIERLVFVAAIDGPGTMSTLVSGQVALAAGERRAVFAFTGDDFAQERALMLIELYRKGGAWRVAATGAGFNGGMDALVRHFGGEVAAAPPLPPPRLSLEKRLEKDAPQLIDLAKQATISLKKQGLQETLARVGVVLDASRSMNRQYKTGRVQELLDRALPLALHFDDDGALDVWAFDDTPKTLPPATVHNIAGYTETAGGGWRAWYGGANDEPKVMRLAIDHYRATPDAPPAYVLFVTDGGIHRNKEIVELTIEAARYPIFWQFMGLGGRNYGALERLDTMPGRLVDNCGFFAIDDLHDLTDEQLYDRLLAEFPQWLRAARTQGVIR
ncbi:VWA domain-containing protein [uncultured Thiodictyon sp.]|uniref:VWA domain-containing protein n=1 Tax=uncultured Thiodictyon sp. TaxID=1846217 RepID=UPI0025EEE45C|nr:VWA domain-containing protein [uncultured Thiodictyon sp.]